MKLKGRRGGMNMTFSGIVKFLDGIAWGPWMLALLVGTGIYVTLRLGLPQIGRLPLALKLAIAPDRG